MYRNEKCFTLIWKIQNINFCVFETKPIISPSFLLRELGETEWFLCLRPNSLGFKNCVACGIRAKDNVLHPNQFEFDYELSILASDGSVQLSEIFLSKLFKKGYYDWSSALYIKSDEVFLPKTGMCISDDPLTIRCRIWGNQNFNLLSRIYFGETLLKVKSESSEGRIENFSHLKPRGKFHLLIFTSSETVFSTFNLCIPAEGNLAIEMQLKYQSICVYIYKIFVRDIFGNKVKCGQGTIYDSKQHFAPLTFSKEHLMKNNGWFLPDDVLTIECEVIFSNGSPTNQFVKTEYSFMFQDNLSLISNAKNQIVISEKQHIETLTALKDDLTSIFNEGVLCDTKLQTATETFSAHSVILSARSPVFKAVFINHTKENTDKYVIIDDLDADTLRRMLLFMYSGNLDNLEYESAKNLYFAADKYDIFSLFQTCSNFMKQNLLLSNCCNILVMSHVHQDKDLKTAVLDFISENDKAVLVSDEWKNLEKTNPQLTIKALRTVWKKKRT